MKLNRLLAKHESLGRNRAQVLIGGRSARVNGAVVTDGLREVTRFDRVELDGAVVQAGVRAVYILLHKPAGYVCATVDAEHPTVMDLIEDPDAAGLHLAGRLDRFSTGLVLLSNDGVWSKRITEPAFKLAKTYLVETHEPIDPAAVAAFARGFYFHTEDVTTRPAELVLVGERVARVTLREGRYHQIKRMFHRVGNRVASLHREAIGGLRLGEEVPPGAWRYLTAGEMEIAGVST
jgi:16S rRNA pseudouridine516 synthase